MKIILIVVLLAIASRKVESQGNCYCTGTASTGGIACTLSTHKCVSTGSSVLCMVELLSSGLLYGCGTTGANTQTTPTAATPTTLATVGHTIECDPATTAYCNAWAYEALATANTFKLHAVQATPVKCMTGSRTIPGNPSSGISESTDNCLACTLSVAVDSADLVYGCVTRPAQPGTAFLTTSAFKIPTGTEVRTAVKGATAMDYLPAAAVEYGCYGFDSCFGSGTVPAACSATSPACYVTIDGSNGLQKWQTRATKCDTIAASSLTKVDTVTRVYSDMHMCCASAGCADGTVNVLGKLCHCQYTADANDLQNCNNITGQELDVYETCAAVNLGEFVLRFGLKACTLTTTGLKFLEYTCCTDSNCLGGALTGDPATEGFWGSLGGGGCSSANNFYPTRIYLLISAAVLFFLLN